MTQADKNLLKRAVLADHAAPKEEDIFPSTLAPKHNQVDQLDQLMLFGTNFRGERMMSFWSEIEGRDTLIHMEYIEAQVEIGYG